MALFVNYFQPNFCVRCLTVAYRIDCVNYLEVT